MVNEDHNNNISGYRHETSSQPAKTFKKTRGVSFPWIGIQIAMLYSQKHTPPHCFFSNFAAYDASIYLLTRRANLFQRRKEVQRCSRALSPLSHLVSDMGLWKLTFCVSFSCTTLLQRSHLRSPSHCSFVWQRTRWLRPNVISYSWL